MTCNGSTTMKIKPVSITIQADNYQWVKILDFYADGATLSAAFDKDGQKNALPREYYLTTEGCNNVHQGKITSMIAAIYAFLKETAKVVTEVPGEDPKDKPFPVNLDTLFTHGRKYRIDATYQGDEFGFLFTTPCDSLNLTITKRRFPKAGKLISDECVNFEQWGVYTDGNGGTYRQVIDSRSEDCGWIKGGTLISKECRGIQQWAKFHDGNGGTYEQLFDPKSAACGWIKGGTLINKECIGTVQWGNYHDGEGGVRREIVRVDSPDCGWIKAGVKQAQFCVGTSLFYSYSDGRGGQTHQLMEQNSKDCGYTTTATTKTPTTTATTKTPTGGTTGTSGTGPTPSGTRPTLPPTTSTPAPASCGIGTTFTHAVGQLETETYYPFATWFRIVGTFASNGGSILNAISFPRDDVYSGPKTAWCNSANVDPASITGLWGNVIYYPGTGQYGGTRNNKEEFERAMINTILYTAGLLPGPRGNLIMTDARNVYVAANGDFSFEVAAYAFEGHG